MANISREVHTSAREKVRLLDRRIPPGIRWLAHMSTSRWHPHPPVHPAVAKMAAAFEAEGWMIRGAWTRNYLLWRNGRTIREARLPILVLPMAYGRLSALQINVFLIVELVDAKTRHRNEQDRDLSPFGRAELFSILDIIMAGSGITIADPFRVHRDATHVLVGVAH